MEVKLEPNLDATTPDGASYEDPSTDDLTPYNLPYLDHENAAILNTVIKNESIDLDECISGNISEGILNIKEEFNPQFDVTNITRPQYDEAIVLHSVLDPISNKVKNYYKCYVCNQLFSYRRQLTCHLRTHTGEKPYSCPLCDYQSNQKINLTCHIRRHHTGEKPYCCTYCDFKTATKYQLICHVRIHTGEKPFSCFFCDYRCAHKVDMIRHMRIHTGEKPFSCTFCDHKCIDKRDLTHHVRTHTGEKPYTCNFCDYKCVKKSYLNTHVKIHTGEKPFSCPLCDYKCSRKAVLSRHLKTHEKVKRVKKSLGVTASKKKAAVKIESYDIEPSELEDNVGVETADASHLGVIKVEDEVIVKDEEIDVQ